MVPRQNLFAAAAGKLKCKPRRTGEAKMRQIKVFGLYGLIGLAALPGSAMAQSTTPQGVKNDAVLTTDFEDLASGGLRPGGTVLNDLELTSVWTGPDGWDAHGNIIGDAGGPFSLRRVGDVQGVSNIDTTPAWRLYEAYVRRFYDNGHLVSSFGIMNLNNVFDVQKYAKLFINASQGIGPEFSQTRPSVFPISGLGTMTSWIIDDKNTIKVGLFDGVSGDPDHRTVFVSVKFRKAFGYNYLSEYKRTFDGGSFKLDHWGYTAPSPRLDGQGLQRKNDGTFAQLAVTLTHERQDPNQGLKTWLRYGVANKNLEEIDQYRGFGLYYVGPFKNRDTDQLGFAIAQAHFGMPYRAITAAQGPYETTYELTYAGPVHHGITIQPDLQYVEHPYGQAAIPNAVVIDLRTVIDFAGGA